MLFGRNNFQLVITSDYLTDGRNVHTTSGEENVTLIEKVLF